MSNNFEKLAVVILAAGQGKRLKCTDMPKVMCDLGGKPILGYILETLEKSGIPAKNIYLVVGFRKDKVMDFFGDKYNYAAQEELKGTAHAAYLGMKALPKDIKDVLVLNGDDSAFYTCQTIRDFVDQHKSSGAALSLLSVEVTDPTLYGRVVRHPDGKIEIIEKEYVTEEQKKINETSAGTFCFDKDWFLEMFPAMPPLRKLGEYGLPTALAMANAQGKKIQVIKLKNNSEWFGINTPEELSEARERKSKTIRK